MCLDTVDKEIKKTKGFGWKRLVRNISGTYSPCCKHGFLTFKPNEWVEDICDYTLGMYTTGFHIEDTRQGARAWFRIGNCVRKVLYQDVVATGIQDGTKVIVARKMMILEAKRR